MCVGRGGAAAHPNELKPMRKATNVLLSGSTSAIAMAPSAPMRLWLMSSDVNRALVRKHSANAVADASPRPLKDRSSWRNRPWAKPWAMATPAAQPNNERYPGAATTQSLPYRHKPSTYLHRARRSTTGSTPAVSRWRPARGPTVKPLRLTSRSGGRQGSAALCCVTLRLP